MVVDNATGMVIVTVWLIYTSLLGLETGRYVRTHSSFSLEYEHRFYILDRDRMKYVYEEICKEDECKTMFQLTRVLPYKVKKATS